MSRKKKFDAEAFRSDGTSIDDLAPKVATLSDEDLAALRKAEEADKNPREKLLAVITAVESERSNRPTIDRAGKPSEPPAKPKWQEPDYTGPLTIGQANWRHRHIKPAAVTGTK